MTKNKENFQTELLHTVLDSSPIPTVISSIESGKILFANKAIGEMLGYELEKVIGRSALEFYADPSRRNDMLKLLKE
ncbi:MAG TPA: PAS domain-containing protein, partial [candidate division Zixibacteria bacterium]|nr:PAS domain-containing protein [candidate division Zixibacteria bacterium]